MSVTNKKIYIDLNKDTSDMIDEILLCYENIFKDNNDKENNT